MDVSDRLDVEDGFDSRKALDDEDRHVAALLRGCTSVNVVGRGVPRVVRDMISEPDRSGLRLDVAIHLRLLDLWADRTRSPFPNDRKLQRSIAEQLGIIDHGDTRELLDKADEHDDYRGIEEERGAVAVVARKIYEHLENKRYLLVLENVPEVGWDKWEEMGVPFPRNLYDGCWVVLSSSKRLEADGLARVGRRHYLDFHLPFRKAHDESIKSFFLKPALRELFMSAERVAYALRSSKTLAVGITRDEVIGSLLYWWMFKPFERVPVQELVDSWVNAELLPRLIMPTSTTTSSSSSSSSNPNNNIIGDEARGGDGVGDDPASSSFGKALLEELCSHYLINVNRQEGDGVWYREPLDERHPLASAILKRGVPAPQPQRGSLSWIAVSLDTRQVLLARGDGAATVRLPLPYLASAFQITINDCWRSEGDPWDNYDQSWSHILTASPPPKGVEEELWQSLDALLVPPTHPDVVVADGKASSEYDLQHVDIINLDELLVRTPRLRLLDLSYTDISSLPESIFFYLPELRVLLLRGCKHLETLAAPTGGASQTVTVRPRRRGNVSKLRVLDLSKSSVREISCDSALLHMITNLEELLLSHTSLEGPLPEELFGRTSRLRVLNLSRNHLVKSLPTSLSAAAAATLEEIHLRGCAGLERVDFWRGQHMPRLRVFTLSDSPFVRRLSLRGCSRLETIELSNLEQLEELDLSGTAIRELPVGIPNLPRLRRLDMLGVQRLRRVPWREMERIPEELNLDQCGCGRFPPAPVAVEGEQAVPKGAGGGEGGGAGGARIFAYDPRVLGQHFGNYSWWREEDSAVALIREQVPGFYVCISPCEHRVVEEEGRRRRLSKRIPLPYQYQAIPVAMEKTMISRQLVCLDNDRDRLQRHVDVLGVGDDCDLEYAGLFLLSADSISLRDNHYRGSLSDDWGAFRQKNWELRRCRLERCHNMKRVFEHDDHFQQLETLWISKLPRLEAVWDVARFVGDERRLSYAHLAFRQLRYVHLEYCPHIVRVFPDNIHLQSLEKLVIKSCPRLQHVFAPIPERYHDETRPEPPQVKLPGLTTVQLLDLPNLESIGGRDTIFGPPRSTWKLKVRGCWKLRELPTFAFPDAPPAGSTCSTSCVHIDGEPQWRKNLLINKSITILPPAAEET